ncbi:MAG: hypothetical protein JSW12_12870, partial [Deltaproteobacteria bacterium]
WKFLYSTGVYVTDWLLFGQVKVYLKTNISTSNPDKPEYRSTKFEARNKSKIIMLECSKH